MTTSMRVALLGLTVTTSSERKGCGPGVCSLNSAAGYAYIHVPVNNTCPKTPQLLSGGPAGVGVNPWG